MVEYNSEDRMRVLDMAAEVNAPFTLSSSTAKPKSDQTPTADFRVGEMLEKINFQFLMPLRKKLVIVSTSPGVTV
jgi:hypothetical protein